MCRLVDILVEIGPFYDVVEVQRVIYLLQEMGIDLDYKFSWASGGPYSRKLKTHILNAKTANYITSNPNVFIIRDAEECSWDSINLMSIQNHDTIYMFKKMFGNSPRDYDIVVLASSILFFIKNEGVSSFEDICRLINDKCVIEYDELMIEDVWEKIHRFPIQHMTV